MKLSFLSPNIHSLRGWQISQPCSSRIHRGSRCLLVLSAPNKPPATQTTIFMGEKKKKNWLASLFLNVFIIHSSTRGSNNIHVGTKGGSRNVLKWQRICSKTCLLFGTRKSKHACVLKEVITVT